MSWLDRATTMASKGSQAAKAERLADLHTRRRATAGQYFTADWIAAGIWQVLDLVCSEANAAGRVLSVVDTSIGSGRLLGPAPVGHCRLFGLDPDAVVIEALVEDAHAADIQYRFEVGRLEDLTLAECDIACINPPYSLNLQSPLMTHYECCAYGTYGPGTSALSHEYALAQALAGAALVAAVLPVSMLDVCRKESRLAAVYTLPADAFAAEQANVRTAVFVFDAEARGEPLLEVKVAPGTPWPVPTLHLPARPRQPVFRLGRLDSGAPSITLPVTGDRRVRVEHHNRRMVLRFGCGLTQAKVLNGLYEEDVLPIEKHRYPAGLRYVGQARLWLDVLLAQEDPKAAFDGVIESIRAHGGDPLVSTTLAGYWRKLIRRHQRAMEPYRHWVLSEQGGVMQAVARRSQLLVAGDLKSPPIRQGERVTARALGGEYEIEKGGQRVLLDGDAFGRRFVLDKENAKQDTEWVLLHRGMLEAFPELVPAARARLRLAGIDWLWPFQEDGVIEHLLKPYGGIAAWKQGTGKARLAIALALVSGRHSLIVVESGLVDEMRREIEDKLKVPQALWRIITRNDDPRTVALRQVNIISYNTLKRVVGGRRTVAKCLRRRFHTVIADEGGLLGNQGSQQSRAVLALAPRKLIVSDGTPIASYPRSILPVGASCAGSGVAHQPFGIRNDAYLSAQLLRTGSACPRGVDEFRERHVVLEWVTLEFKEGLSEGAKREVPRIARLSEFRRWLQPLVQRRLRNEPEVEPFAGCPSPIYQTTTVGWDKKHLRHYLDIALHFVQWYQQHVAAARADGRQTNLVAVLARINAVMMAASCPHKGDSLSQRRYAPLTSKQRVALEKLKVNVEAGQKTLLYAYSPSVVERLACELSKDGIESVLFHGKIPITKRTRELDERFRFGTAPVLLSTWCGQKGLNIPQAKRVILYDRNWTGRTEDQAIHRTQRPDQDARVVVERLHLAGSIDEYMAQVVEWKEAAAHAGLDWGSGATESDVFRHLDSIIEQFCQDTLAMSSRAAFEVMAA